MPFSTWPCPWPSSDPRRCSRCNDGRKNILRLGCLKVHWKQGTKQDTKSPSCDRIHHNYITIHQNQMNIAKLCQVRRSLCDAMRYAMDAHVASGNSCGLLCDVATSSPMAHMPPVKDLAAVGGTEIIPVSQLSGSQQLEERAQKTAKRATVLGRFLEAPC